MLSSTRSSRAEHPHVHRSLIPTSVTIASRPSDGIRMGGANHDFLENGREIFLRGGLDRANQIDFVDENGFWVHRALSHWPPSDVTRRERRAFQFPR